VDRPPGCPHRLDGFPSSLCRTPTDRGRRRFRRLPRRTAGDTASRPTSAVCSSSPRRAGAARIALPVVGLPDWQRYQPSFRRSRYSSFLTVNRSLGRVDPVRSWLNSQSCSRISKRAIARPRLGIGLRNEAEPHPHRGKYACRHITIGLSKICRIFKAAYVDSVFLCRSQWVSSLAMDSIISLRN